MIEPVHPYSSFQNGNYRLSLSCITEERLGHISRLKGCILSHSHPPQVQEVSPLPFYGENLPISSASVQALPSSLCFHQSSETVVKHCRRQGMCLHAYLDDWLQPWLPVPVHSTPGSVTVDGFEPGICPKLGQIRANSQSNVLFPGCSIRSGEGYDRTFSGQDSEIANDNTEDVASHSASAREVHSLLGQMESVARLLPYGRAHKRLLQWHVKDRWSQATQSCDYHISLGPWFRQAVEQWLNKDFLHAMVPLVHPQPDFYLFMDASLDGLGRPSGRSQFQASGLFNGAKNT